ncbi:MAG: response regulator [Pseudomonadota bacterium]
MATVLLVDDSSTILTSMGQIVRGAGYKVEEASSGEAALSKLQGGGAVDLIITDYNMPGMNGAELIAAARKLPSFRFTPILVLTTESKQSKRDAAKSAGATGWLTKPVKPENLIGALKKLIPGS